jgi:WD40 repeat protein
LVGGLKSAVRAVACTPVGSRHNLALCGCADGTARLLDLDRANPRQGARDLAPCHRGAINGVAFSPDGERCATCGDDRAIRLWETATGALLSCLSEAHRNDITSVQFISDSRLLSAGRDHRLVVWDVEPSKTPVKVGPDFEGRGGDVAQVGVSPDGQTVLFDQGRELSLLSLADKEIRGTLQDPADATNFSTLALFAPDGKMILTNGSAPGGLRLWRTPSGAARASELRQLVWTKGAVTCGAFAPANGAFLVTGTQDHQVLVWTMPEKKEVESCLEGRLTRVEKALDMQSRQVRVWADLSNPGWLLPGSRATMVISPIASQTVGPTCNRASLTGGGNRPAAAGVCLGVRLTVMGKTICISSPCVWGALCGSISRDEEGRSVLRGGSRQRRKGGGNVFEGKILAIAPSGIRIDRWRRNRGSGEDHLGKVA